MAQATPLIKRNRILSSIPTDGNWIVPTSLLSSVNQMLAAENFDAIELNEQARIIDGLIESHKLERRQGGSVKRINVQMIQNQQPRLPPSADEHQIYVHFADYLKNVWRMKEQIQENLCRIVLTADRRAGGNAVVKGKWTIADITLIVIYNYQHIPGKALNLITFEIKRSAESFKIENVFETASQSIYAHQSYLCLQLPATLNDSQVTTLERINILCREFGIGLITFTNENYPETYDVLIQPIKTKSPEKRNVNQYITDLIVTNRDDSNWLNPHTAG